MTRFTCVAGTRPEFVKLAPVVAELRKRGAEVLVVSTGQHTDLLCDSPLQADYNCGQAGCSDPDTIVHWLAKTSYWAAKKLTDTQNNPTIVLGDTASALAGARVAHQYGVPLIHIEAGVRSHDLANPNPEEGYRVEIDRLADWHFCPTEGNLKNVVDEFQADLMVCHEAPGLKLTTRTIPTNWHVVGNPGIDQLLQTVSYVPPEKRSSTVLVTLHRRESFGEPMCQIVTGINQVAKQRKDLQFIVPFHPNGAVEAAFMALARKEGLEITNLQLTGPMPPQGFQDLLARCQAVVTDSGGVQEEAAALGIPCVVAREVTDRPESVESGHAILAGRTTLGVQLGLGWALDKDDSLTGCHPVTTPGSMFGDGRASQRIADLLLNHGD